MNVNALMERSTQSQLRFRRKTQALAISMQACSTHRCTTPRSSSMKHEQPHLDSGAKAVRSGFRTNRCVSPLQPTNQTIWYTIAEALWDVRALDHDFLTAKTALTPDIATTIRIIKMIMKQHQHFRAFF